MSKPHCYLNGRPVWVEDCYLDGVDSYVEMAYWIDGNEFIHMTDDEVDELNGSGEANEYLCERCLEDKGYYKK